MKSIKFVIVMVLLLLIAVTGFVAVNNWHVMRNMSHVDVSVAKVAIDIDKDKAIEQFAKSLTFRTISNENTYQKNAEFDRLFDFLKQSYPQVFSELSVTKIRHHGLVLKWQGKNSSLMPVLMMAHQDVVPIAPGTMKDWQHDPFAGVISDGYVWGRGAIDDKASLMAILASTSELLKSGFTPERTVYFYFGDDEESGGDTATAACEYFKSQKITFKYIFDEGGIIADGVFPGLKSPIALISVAEKGIMNLKLTANTEGGHSSMPSKRLAIGEVSRAITAVLNHPFPSHINIVLQKLLNKVATQKPLYEQWALTNTWLTSPLLIHKLSKSPAMAALLHTTQAPTVFNAGSKSNVLPQHASAIVNFRIAPSDNMNSVIEHVRKAINNPEIKIEKLMGSNPSPLSSTNSQAYRLLSATILTIYGDDMIVSPFILAGGTDSRHFMTIAENIYRFMPIVVNKDDLPRFHGTNERLATSAYIKMIEFYAAFISQQ